jgi:histone deacetylase complex regulatory component SIN3
MNLLYSREINRRQNSWFTKPISEFSLKGKCHLLTDVDCKIIDKSYTTFPSDFDELICSGMTELGKEILNAKWVSVPRGSEYFSFHLKNEEEERLFH